MRRRSGLLDQSDVDPNARCPVVATHAGYRFGEQEYMLDRDASCGSRARDGVIGLIMAQHQLNDGLPGAEARRRSDESFEVICRHIDRIAEITGSHSTPRSAPTSTASSSRR